MLLVQILSCTMHMGTNKVAAEIPLHFLAMYSLKYSKRLMLNISHFSLSFQTEAVAFWLSHGALMYGSLNPNIRKLLYTSQLHTHNDSKVGGSQHFDGDNKRYSFLLGWRAKLQTNLAKQFELLIKKQFHQGV